LKLIQGFDMTNMITRSALKRSSERKIFTVQRKANYGDKTRIRRADMKKIALRDGKCADSAEMKRRLKLLGISLDLRLTSAWIAIVRELLSEIAALATVITLRPATGRNPASTPNIEPRYDSSQAEFAQIEVGDRTLGSAARIKDLW
jgi:hypothetical protein